MTELLDSLLNDVERRVRADDPDAVGSAARLAERYPESVKAWCLLAYAHARQGNTEDAILDITRAIRLSPREPALLFDRGRYKLKTAQYRQAVDDFGEALALCDLHKDDYYRESLHFLRADALLKLGLKAEAQADLGYVRDDFALWTTELRTKKALSDECLK